MTAIAYDYLAFLWTVLGRWYWTQLAKTSFILPKWFSNKSRAVFVYRKFSWSVDVPCCLEPFWKVTLEIEFNSALDGDNKVPGIYILVITNRLQKLSTITMHCVLWGSGGATSPPLWQQLPRWWQSGLNWAGPKDVEKVQGKPLKKSLLRGLSQHNHCQETDTALLFGLQEEKLFLSSAFKESEYDKVLEVSSLCNGQELWPICTYLWNIWWDSFQS